MRAATEPQSTEAASRVTHRLLIESDPHQTRVAVLESDQLTEIYLERHRQRGVVGNVYKGRVSRILPGMQAAFVNIGLERDAFLFVGDVREALASMDALAEADPQTGEFPVQELPPIEELLEQGQDLVVQVVKAPLPNKGARITTEITLPGRYLVLVPTVPSLGVSRRIRDAEERDRLRGLLEALEANEHGLIVRTAGEGKEREEFAADLDFLERRWSAICRRAEEAAAPSLLHEDWDLALRSVRDRFGDDFDELLVDGGAVHERILDLVREMDPQMEGRIRRFDDEGGLFDSFGIESELDAALKTRVWLRSGGYIVINPTEALVAIDVNTGRFVGETSLEDTVVRTNLEAVVEIVRQIRLRDLSGIIVIDFIDMNEPQHRTEVFEALQAELRKDRAKNQVLSLSDFGLVEITRKRSRDNLQRLLTRDCPECGGSGRVLSSSTTCFKLRRELLRRRERFIRAAASGGPGPLVKVHPEVLEALRGEEREVLEELEETLGGPLRLEADAALPRERFEIAEE